MTLIRQFSPADAQAVVDLVLSIQQSEFGIPITLEAQPDLQDIPGFYQRENGGFWVAESQGAVIGTIALLDIGNRQAALRKMFVAESHRGPEHGVARQLLATLLEWCRSRGISEIYLGTTGAFLAAHRFYEKNGFKELSKRELPPAFPVMAVDTKFYVRASDGAQAMHSPGSSDGRQTTSVQALGHEREMAQMLETAHVELVPLDLSDLRRLAASEPIDSPAPMVIPEGALPPAHVAAQALAQLDAGTPAFWCVPFLIVATASGSVLGGCRFKGLPIAGSVEIGYGVAIPERGRGVATAAVAQLIKMAASTGEVDQVVAHILPDNIASSKVVARLGFTKGHSLIDSNGELVVRWTCPIAT